MVTYPVAVGAGSCQWLCAQRNIHNPHEHIGQERQRGRGGPQRACVSGGSLSRTLVWNNKGLLYMMCATQHRQRLACDYTTCHVTGTKPNFIASCRGTPAVQGGTCKCGHMGTHTQTVQCKSTWYCTYIQATVANCTAYLWRYMHLHTHTCTHHAHANNPPKSNKHTTHMCPGESLLHTHI